MFKEKLDSLTRERVTLFPHRLSRRSISSFSEEQCRVRLSYHGENLIRCPDNARRRVTPLTLSLSFREIILATVAINVSAFV